MLTKVCPLPEEDRALLLEMYMPIFLDGLCYEFACGIHAETEWPMFGLFTQDDIGEVLRHAVVQPEPSCYFDARGYVPKVFVGRPFGVMEHLDLRPITRSDLEAVRPVDDREIERAISLAQLLWPNAPWKKRRTDAVQVFLIEFLSLCKKHGFWLRAPVPAAAPILSLIPSGAEFGYEATPHTDGTSFFINRVLGD